MKTSTLSLAAAEWSRICSRISILCDNDGESSFSDTVSSSARSWPSTDSWIPRSATGPFMIASAPNMIGSLLLNDVSSGTRALLAFAASSFWLAMILALKHEGWLQRRRRVDSQAQSLVCAGTAAVVTVSIPATYSR